MCIQQMGQRAILAVGSWNQPSVVCIRHSLKSIKGNFHTQFNSECKMLGSVAGVSPMGIRVAVGKSCVWWQILTDRVTGWSREIWTKSQIVGHGRVSEAGWRTQLNQLPPTSLIQALKKRLKNLSRFLCAPSPLLSPLAHSCIIPIFETICLLIFPLSIFFPNKYTQKSILQCRSIIRMPGGSRILSILATQGQVCSSDLLCERGTSYILPGYSEGYNVQWRKGFSEAEKPFWRQMDSNS